MGKLETITVNRSGSAKSPTIKSKYPYRGEGYTRGTREKGANQTYAFQSVRLVGAVGVEPTTNGLKGRCSATELRPCGSHHIIRKNLLGMVACTRFRPSFNFEMMRYMPTGQNRCCRRQDGAPACARIAPKALLLN